MAKIQKEEGGSVQVRIERWRKQQRLKQGERLYSGPKHQLYKFFKPNQWNHGHLPQLEGKLFLVVETPGVHWSVSWSCSDGKFPLFWFSKRNNYLGVHKNGKTAKTGITVMATGNACERSKQADCSAYGHEQGSRFVEVLTTDTVGYLNLKCLRLVSL